MASRIKFLMEAGLVNGTELKIRKKLEKDIKPKIDAELSTYSLKNIATDIKNAFDKAFNLADQNINKIDLTNSLSNYNEAEIKANITEALKIYQYESDERIRIEKETQKELERLEKERLQKQRREESATQKGSVAATRAETTIQIGENKLLDISSIVKTEKVQEFKRLTDENSKSIRDNIEILKELKRQYDNNEISIDNYEKETREATDAINQSRTSQLKLNKEMDASKKTFKDFGKTLVNNMKQFASWITSTNIVMAVIKTVKQMIRTVIELDKVFTNIQMVTGYTNEKMQELKVTYTELAQQLKVTTKEVGEAANEWLRQGLSVEQTTTALTAALKFAKVASISTTEATQLLTSAMKGYELTVENLVSITDKLNKVDMASATSAADLAKAMSETAASAKLAGIQMDTLIGYLATMQEVTQDSAESIGNSMKSILARLTKIAAGVDVDDFGESLNDVEKVLIKYNISLRDSYGEMRNMEVVLDQVADKWKILSDAQRNQISTAIAGTRQAEKFKVLMQNYSRSIDLATESLNSAGTTMNKYGVYMESIEAATNNMTAAFEKLSTSLIDSGLISSLFEVVAALLDLIEVAQKFIHLGKILEYAVNTVAKLAEVVIYTVEGLFKLINAFGDLIDSSGIMGEVIENLLNPFKMLETMLYSMSYAMDKVGEWFTHLFGKKTQKEIEEVENKINELGDAYSQFSILMSQSELSEVQSKTLEKLQEDMKNTSSYYKQMLQDGEDMVYAYYMANLQMRAEYAESIGKDTYLSNEGVRKNLARLETFYNGWQKLDSLTQKNNMQQFETYIEAVKNASQDEAYQNWVKTMIGDYEDAYRAAKEYDPISYEISQIKKKLEEEKAAWEEEKTALEKKKELEEKILAIQEAQEKLAQAKNKRARIYRAGRGFVYEEDFSAVQEAQKNLKTAQENLYTYQKDIYYENALENLEELQSAEQAFWRDTETGLQDWYNSSKMTYKLNAENYEDMINKIIDITNQANVKLANTELGNIISSIPSNNISSSSLNSDNVASKLNISNGFIPTSYSIGTGNVINISNISLPNVNNAEDFIEEINAISRLSLQMGTSHK